MTTEFDVHLVRMNRGLIPSDQLQKVYDDVLNRIAEKRRSIELDQQILEILEKEELRRR